MLLGIGLGAAAISSCNGGDDDFRMGLCRVYQRSWPLGVKLNNMFRGSDTVYLRDIGCSEKSEPNSVILLSSLWGTDETRVDALQGGKYHDGSGVLISIRYSSARNGGGQGLELSHPSEIS